MMQGRKNIKVEQLRSKWAGNNAHLTN